MKRILIIFVTLFTIFALEKNTFAANTQNFNPGNIIDDAVFTNSESMTVEQIQNFLNSKVSCDNYGRKTSELGGGTRAQWLSARGYSTPIRCISDYVENPSTGENNYGRDVKIQGGMSAAQIIHAYSRQFNINPQVIIATLQKENSMITDEWPTLKQFQEAMGFGCPDNVAPGAPACDPAYKSFSSQIYQAARHFRGYIDAKAGWHVTFNTGWNNIGYHPNSACGSSKIFIENRATVALYTYTPYQPNRAAINAGYGSGDSCSSYGNRNFYNYFTDWFGTVRSAQIVRTFENVKLYLISDDKKYAINTMELLAQFNSISREISFVSQGYIDSFSNGGDLGIFVRNPKSGAIYLIDSGKKFHITSCDIIADYGSSCSDAKNLTENQLSKFSDGGILTKNVKSDNLMFYISKATRSQIVDDQALAESGISGNFTELSSHAIGNLKIATPFIRQDILIQNSKNGDLYYVDRDEKLKYVNGEIFSILKGKVQIRTLFDSSVELLNKEGDFSPAIQSEDGSIYLLGEGLLHINFVPSEFTKVSSSITQSISPIENPKTILFGTSPDVYYVNSQKIHKINDWESVLYNSRNGKVSRVVVSAKKIFNYSSKPYISPNRLVKSSDSPNVFIIDGELGTKKLLGSFKIAEVIGLNQNVSTFSRDTLNSYSTDGVVSSLINCGGDLYLASEGSLKYVNGQKFLQYGISGDKFERYTKDFCTSLKKSGSLTDFALAENGAVYKIENGQRRHIRSWNKFIELGGKSSDLVKLDNSIINKIPEGIAY